MAVEYLTDGGMIASPSAIRIRAPNIGSCVLAAANVAKDGTGALGTPFTPGSNGSMLLRVYFNSAQLSRAANSAMTGCLFLTDSAGANPYFLAEIALPVVTGSTTAIGASRVISFAYDELFLPPGVLLKASISVYAGVQDRIVVVAVGGNF